MQRKIIEYVNGRSLGLIMTRADVTALVTAPY